MCAILQLVSAPLDPTLRFMINGGGQIKRGDFKDFEKLLNGGDKINGEVGTKYKREETKL